MGLSKKQRRRNLSKNVTIERKSTDIISDSSISITDTGRFNDPT